MGHEQKCTLTGHSAAVNSVAYSPDGKQIVSGSDDNTVKVWDAQTGEEVNDHVLPSSHHLLLRALVLTFVLIHEQECTLTGHWGYVMSVAYSPDGKHIVSGSYDNDVKVWDAQTGKLVSVLLCHRPFICCCVECSDLRVWSMSRSAR